MDPAAYIKLTVHPSPTSVANSWGMYSPMIYTADVAFIWPCNRKLCFRWSTWAHQAINLKAIVALESLDCVKHRGVRVFCDPIVRVTIVALRLKSEFGLHNIARVSGITTAQYLLKPVFRCHFRTPNRTATADWCLRRCCDCLALHRNPWAPMGHCEKHSICAGVTRYPSGYQGH